MEKIKSDWLRIVLDFLTVTTATLLCTGAIPFYVIFLFVFLVIVQILQRSPTVPLLLVLVILLVLQQIDRQRIRNGPDAFISSKQSVLLGEASRLLQERIEEDEQLLRSLGSKLTGNRASDRVASSRLGAFELLQEELGAGDGRQGLVLFDDTMSWYAWSGEPRGVNIGLVRVIADQGPAAQVLRGAVYTVLTMAIPLDKQDTGFSGVLFLSDLVSSDARLENVAFIRNGFLDRMREGGRNWGEVLPGYGEDTGDEGVTVTAFGRPVATLKPPHISEIGFASGENDVSFQLTVIFLLIVWFLVTWQSLHRLDAAVMTGIPGNTKPYVRVAVGLSIVAAIMFLLRQALIWLNVPSVFRETSFFSPNLFASGLLDVFSRSVGDFFLSTSCFVLVAFWFLFRMTTVRRQVGKIGCRSGRVIAVVASVGFTLSAPYILSRLFSDTSTELLAMAIQVESPAFAIWEGATFMLLLAIILISASILAASLESEKKTWMAIVIFLGAVGLLLSSSLGKPEPMSESFAHALVVMATLSAIYILAAGLLGESKPRSHAGTAVFMLVGVVAASSILFPLVIGKRYEVIAERAEELIETASKPIDTWATYILEEFIRESEERSVEFSDELVSRELAFARWADSPLSDAGSASSLSIFDRQGRRVSTFSLLAEPLPDELAAYLLDEVYSRQESFIYNGFVEGEQYYIAAVPLSDSLGLTGMMLARIPTGFQRRIERGSAPFLRNADVLPPGMSLQVSILDTEEDLPVPLRQAESGNSWVMLEDGIGQQGRVLASARNIDPEGRWLLMKVPVIGTGVMFGMLVAILLLNILFALPALLIAGFFCYGRGYRYEIWRGRASTGSFRTRLSVSLFIFALIPTLVWGVLSRRTIVDRMARETKAEAERILNDSELFLIGGNFSDPVVGADREQLPGFPFPPDEYMASLADIMEAELFLYAENVLIASSRPDLIQSGIMVPWIGAGAYAELFLEGVRTATDVLDIGSSPYMMVYRRISDGGRDMNFGLATPMLLRQERVKKEVIELNYTILVAVVTMLVGSVLMGYFVASLLSKPLSQLRTGTGQIASGNLEYRLVEKRYDEFGQLFDSFNEMAGEIRDSQRMLLSEKSKIESIVKNVGAGVLVLTREGDLKLSNEMAAEILGEDISRYADRSLITTPLASGIWKDFIVWATDLAEKGEKQFVVSTDGGEIYLKSTKTVTPSAEDEVLLIVIFEDATESIRSQRVLAWADLARQIAHEIKNPLTPIRLAVQHIRRLHRDRAPNFDEKLDQNVDLILKEISRLGETASQFSTFAKTEASTCRPVDPVPIVEDILQLYAGDENFIRYSFQNAAKRTLVQAEEEGLRKILINLIENSREAVTDGGVITIRLEEQADRLVLSVEDNGEGIPREYLRKVFDPDFTTRTYGTGLGLTIVKRIVESWDGTVEIQSAQGEGTAVRVHLRCAGG